MSQSSDKENHERKTAKHECFNSWVRIFIVSNTRFPHTLAMCKYCFHVVLNIVYLSILNGEPVYDEWMSVIFSAVFQFYSETQNSNTTFLLGLNRDTKNIWWLAIEKQVEQLLERNNNHTLSVLAESFLYIKRNKEELSYENYTELIRISRNV